MVSSANYDHNFKIIRNTENVTIYSHAHLEKATLSPNGNFYESLKNVIEMNA